jgi:hypothetical protein
MSQVNGPQWFMYALLADSELCLASEDGFSSAFKGEIPHQWALPNRTTGILISAA